MTTELACIDCGAPLQKPHTGRPPRQCKGCRHLDENERQRLSRRLDALALELDGLRLQRAEIAAGLSVIPGEVHARRVELQIGEAGQRIAEYTEKLRALFHKLGG